METFSNDLNDIEDIHEVLRVCDVLHVTFKGDEYPYVLPMSFGVDQIDDTFVLYISSQKDGEKARQIKKDPHVSIEVDVVYEYYINEHGLISSSYSSIIGQGIVEELDRKDYDEAMNQILLHYGFEGLDYDHDYLDDIVMYKIVLKNYTGKRHLKSSNSGYYML